MAYDLTVAVAAHSETIVAGPTMRSAERAIEEACAAGLSVERVIAFDAATEACRAFFTQPAFQTWRKVELNERDLGLARNATVRECNGRWIAFLDADDLFSENWLVEGVSLLQAADKEGRRAIVHPELNIVFDGGNYAQVNLAQKSELFSNYMFYFGNYYDSLCLLPREAVIEVPYRARDRSNGFGFEDWCWNIETAAAGWEHVIAKDTIIFKRRRDGSLLSELWSEKTVIWDIDAIKIDRVDKW